MPNINPQQKTPLPSPLHIPQQPYRYHIIQPIILLIPSLKHNPQLQPTLRLRRPRSPQQNVRAVVRAQIVPRVSAENAGLRVCEAPVCAEVEDLAYEGVC
jgi:hypothetical protein